MHNPVFRGKVLGTLTFPGDFDAFLVEMFREFYTCASNLDANLFFAGNGFGN